MCPDGVVLQPVWEGFASGGAIQPQRAGLARQSGRSAASKLIPQHGSVILEAIGLSYGGAMYFQLELTSCET